jgi:hypothetical protein
MTQEELRQAGFTVGEIPTFANVDREVVDLARRLWLAVGVKPVVTSAYRTAATNAAAGGVQNSQHMLGKALDLVFPGVNPARVIQAAESLGAKGLALQWPTGSVHVDTRSGPVARWGERADGQTKTFNHPLAEIVALFTGAPSAGGVKIGPVPIPRTTAGKVGAGVLIVAALIIALLLLTR